MKQELRNVTTETQSMEMDARQIAQLWNQTGCVREEVSLLPMCVKNDNLDLDLTVPPTLRTVSAFEEMANESTKKYAMTETLKVMMDVVQTV